MGKGGAFLRKARAKVSDVPTGFVWVEQGRLAASGYPASRGQLEWLVGKGITSVLTLTPAPLPKAMVDGLPLKLLHLPMEDHAVPSVETLSKGARLVRESLLGGDDLVVHCLAGEGRTGSVLAAYLMEERKLTSAEALADLRKIKPLFVEHQQEIALREFESYLKAAR
jgi:atypical dual specificity phosphatase